jgi:hypothetical protein
VRPPKSRGYLIWPNTRSTGTEDERKNLWTGKDSTKNKKWLCIALREFYRVAPDTASDTLGVSVMNVRGSSFICHRTTNAIDTIDINSDREAIAITVKEASGTPFVLPCVRTFSRARCQITHTGTSRERAEPLFWVWCQSPASGRRGRRAFGGVQLSTMMSMMTRSVHIGADQLSYGANKTAKIGAYAQRELEWAFQATSPRSAPRKYSGHSRGRHTRDPDVGMAWIEYADANAVRGGPGNSRARWLQSQVSPWNCGP